MKNLLLLFAFTVTLIPSAYADCVCPPVAENDQSDLATYVFNGDVWDLKLDKPTGRHIITFDVNDTFKGKPPEKVDVVDDRVGTNCALDFKEGDTYLVYVRWVWGLRKTSRCWGTKLLREAGASAATLGPGDAWKAKLYEKMQVNCMGRYDTTCCLDSLKAIREGHYLPPTGDDCPDGMIPDRLRCDGSYIWCIPATDPNRHNQRKQEAPK